MPVKKMKAGRRRRGGAKGGLSWGDVKDVLSKGADIAKDVVKTAKDKKIVSGLLKDVEATKPLGQIVEALGGKRKRRARKPKAMPMPMKGGFDWGVVGDLLGNIAKVPLSAVSGLTSGLQYGISNIGKGRGGRKGGAMLRPPAVLLPSQQFGAYM